MWALWCSGKGFSDALSDLPTGFAWRFALISPACRLPRCPRYAAGSRQVDFCLRRCKRLRLFTKTYHLGNQNIIYWHPQYLFLAIDEAHVSFCIPAVRHGCLRNEPANTTPAGRPASATSECTNRVSID
jgi:hypothetical protein